MEHVYVLSRLFSLSRLIICCHCNYLMLQGRIDIKVHYSFRNISLCQNTLIFTLSFRLLMALGHCNYLLYQKSEVKTQAFVKHGKNRYFKKKKSISNESQCLHMISVVCYSKKGLCLFSLL